MSETKERLFLLDGTALAYRAHFAFLRARLTDTKGRPTGAIYGFVATLLKLIRDEDPDHLGCCFVLRDVVRAFNIPVLELPGFEADDVMATVAQRAAKAGIDAYIVTGDKDLCQSVEPGVFIYNILKPGQDTEVLDEQGVLESWGVPATKVADVLALMGDASDNVPGVPGVGKKTAVKLLNEYGHIQDVLAAAAADPPLIKQKKLGENLRNHRDLAELSYELVLVKRDVPVDVTFDELRLGDPDKPRLQELFKELNFTRLLADVTDEVPTEEMEHDYRIVRTKDELDAMLAVLRKGDLVAFDTETTGLDPLQADLVGMSFSVKAGTGYYVPLNLEPPVLGGDGDDAVQRVLEALRPFLEDESVKKCGQNAKYDLLAMRRAGIEVGGMELDTLIASFCLDPGQRQHSLDALSLRYFNYRKTPTSELIGSGRNQITMDQVEVDRVGEYACEDADFTYRLACEFAPRLEKAAVGPLYRDVEMPLVDVLRDMEWEGVRLDVDMLVGLSADLEKQAGTLEREICELAGEAFNVKSPKQLGVVLFDNLKIQGRKHVRKTKTGWATDERTLRSFSDNPIVSKLLRHRSLVKLRGTYTEALPKLVNPHTGRVHTSYSQVAAVTGRLASSDPNLQNIPIRTEEGREIRRAFVPRADGWTLLSADYSQIELRVLAHLSEDEHLCTAFADGADIHRETAARIFGMAPALITPEIRGRAKAINFGIVYGMGATRLAQDTGITRKEATSFIENYFKAYPGVKRFVDGLKVMAREQGYVTTLLGRRRPLADMLESSNQRVQAAVDNVAVNTPIQGTAADIIKLAMLRLHGAMRDAALESRMILQVHDELIFDVAPGELDAMKDLVRERMEGAYPLRVPLLVDMGWGADWLTAH
jgi:DNA polymerase-1